MLKKFALWFICFGLSFLVSDVLGWTEQGMAFIYIHLGGSIIIILGFIVFLVIAGVITDSTAEESRLSFLMFLTIFGTLAVILFAT